MHVLLASPFDDPTTKWMVIGLAIITILYAVLRPAMRRKDPMSRLNKTKPTSSLAQQRAAERDMSNLLVELSEMARQITAQLDTRAAKLQSLLEDADARINELKSLGATTDSVRSDNGVPGEADCPFPGPRPSSPASTAASEGSLTEPEPINPRYAEIYTLADDGLTPHEIAQRLGRPNGEIQLILALRPRP
jgi:hypothetical protein